MLGFCCLKTSYIASLPSASPVPVHQLKTSSLPAPPAADAPADGGLMLPDAFAEGEAVAADEPVADEPDAPGVEPLGAPQADTTTASSARSVDHDAHFFEVFMLLRSFRRPSDRADNIYDETDECIPFLAGKYVTIA
jgi:hypothetical protein